MSEISAVHDGERVLDSPIMSNALRVCRKCGAEIFADAPEGLCTACLFETGLALLADDGPPASEGGSTGKPGRCFASVMAPKKIHALGERVPSQKAERIPANKFGDFGDYELLEE